MKFLKAPYILASQGALWGSFCEDLGETDTNEVGAKTISIKGYL